MNNFLTVLKFKIIIRIITIRPILFLSICLICSGASGQIIESEYLNKLNSGDTIYVITNRSIIEDPDNLEFDNYVRSDMGMAYLEITFFQPDSLHITSLDSLEFIDHISSINNDWLIFVHGDSKTFEQSVMRGFDIQYYHDVNVIIFSWPTKDSELNGIKNFKNSKVNAITSANHFNELMKFSSLLKESNPEFKNGHSFSIFFHSLGNSLIKNYALDGSLKNGAKPVFDNLILNAAAVNQQNHKQWVEKLLCQDRIYITSNKSDFNLKGVRIFTKDGKQLGEKIKNPVAENAIYLNFSKAVGFRTPTGTTHTFFIGEVPEENNTIKNIYYDLFHGNEIDLSNTSTFNKRKDGIGYDINKPN